MRAADNSIYPKKGIYSFTRQKFSAPGSLPGLDDDLAMTCAENNKVKQINITNK